MSESADQQPARNGKQIPKWLWITLVLSLAGNLLIVGAVGGSFLAGHGYGRGHHRIFGDISSERRDEVRKIMRAHRKQVRPFWQNVHEARKNAREVLEREPLDENAALEALKALYEAEAQARESSGPMLLDVVKKLRPEERRAILKYFLRDKRGRRHRKR